MLFVIAMLSSFALEVKAQTFTLSGRVTDDWGDPMEMATVSVLSQMKVAMTNMKGEFSMELASEDSVVVKFSMVGYQTRTRVLRKPKGKQTLQIRMLEANNQLGEVVVTEQVRQTTGTAQLDVKDVKQAPSASGNAVEEMIQGQAGVSTHSELSSQYNVRGGSFDENSVYINNVEMYRPFLVRSGQQEGLSIINPDMVEKVGFSTGGFEAKYGDKMSSALDIQYRRPKRTEGSISASLLGASAYLGVTDKKNKFTWSNGIRYKSNKYLLGSMQTKAEYEPNFLDYQTYLTYTPNKRWSFELIGDLSENHYNFYPENRETKFGTMKNVKSFLVYFDGWEKDIFRTYSGVVNITRHFGDNFHVSLIGSAFSTNEQERYDLQGQYWLTQTETSENLGVGTYMEHARNYLKANVRSLKLMMKYKVGKHNMETAFTFKNEHVRERSKEYEMRDSSGYSIPHTGKDLHLIYSLSANNELKANRVEAYVQDTYKFMNASQTTFYTLNYGARISHWNFNHETIVSPRISLAIVPSWNNDVTLRFATGLYYQAPFFKELCDTITTNGTTYIRQNDKIKSQRSIHFIAAYDQRFKMMNRPFKFTAEAYHKMMDNLVPYTVNNVKIVYDASQQCKGNATGLDLKLYGEFVPGSDSWLTFSIMKTRMKINGKSIPLPTDQRYSLNLFFTDYFPGTDRWKMSLKLAYADGLPFGAPHRSLDTMPFRSPAYKRADIGMSFRALNNEKHENKKNLIRNIWVGIDCLNLFGINNVNSYYWITDVTNQQYAVPNYLTGRQLNLRVIADF